MQWALDGKPTWYASKAMALWGIVAFALAVRLLIWAAMTYVPDKVNGPEIGLLLFSYFDFKRRFLSFRCSFFDLTTGTESMSLLLPKLCSLNEHTNGAQVTG